MRNKLTSEFLRGLRESQGQERYDLKVNIDKKFDTVGLVA